MAYGEMQWLIDEIQWPTKEYVMAYGEMRWLIDEIQWPTKEYVMAYGESGGSLMRYNDPL